MDCDNKEEWSNAEYRIVNKVKASAVMENME